MPDEPQPLPPLRPDLRLWLETLQDGLGFAFAGVAAVNFPEPYNVLVPLVIGSVLVMIRRLLGRSYIVQLAQSDNQVKSVIAQNSVLQSDVSPKVLATAVEAGTAVRTNTVTPPPTVPTP